MEFDYPQRGQREKYNSKIKISHKLSLSLVTDNDTDKDMSSDL
jgi:hypothetical protein